jgi:multicomponent Na+:H+ antiporter subunit D
MIPDWLNPQLHPSMLALPVALPMLAAAILVAFGGSGQNTRLRLLRSVAFVAAVINFGLALLILWATTLSNGGEGARIVMQMGRWPAPFGITLIADGLTAIMLTAVGLLTLLILPYAGATLDPYRERSGFYPLTLFLLMGVNGAFVTGDLFNLYVFFEVFLMSSFVLITLGGTPGQINGGIRYVILNLMASLVFLAAAGITYGTLGTLNMAHIALRMPEASASTQLLLAGLMLIAFGSKAALFPLFFWLPASYHTPHPAVSALFGGILTKVGVYVLFRLYPLFFPELLVEWQPLILTIAALTMVVGVLGAFAQPTIRRLLSFHIISQVGYMIMGLGLALSVTTAGGGAGAGVGFALAAGIFFMVHNMLVKTALLMGGGVAEIELGSGNLGAIGGLAKRRPVLAVIFFIAAFSLAGIPPSSGFVGKLTLLQAGFGSQAWIITGVSLFVSLLTTMSMIRLWQYIFWGEFRTGSAQWRPLVKSNAHVRALVPMGLLVAVSLALAIFFQPTLDVATTAARQVIDRDGYIAAVNPLVEIPSEPELWEPPLSGEAPTAAALPATDGGAP